jgi:hypothetical protein
LKERPIFTSILFFSGKTQKNILVTIQKKHHIYPHLVGKPYRSAALPAIFAGKRPAISAGS